MKFVVSFTTSPSRVSKIKPMIDSIITQTKPVDLFLLNIPHVFPRTGEKYTIPDFVSKSVTINVVEKDYGPATKLVPTIKYLIDNDYDKDDTYIVYLDDDIEYRPDMISVLNFLFMLNKTPRVLCGGGFHFVMYENKIRLAGQRKHNDDVSIVEGYASVCVPLSIFEEDFLPYIEKYTSGKEMKQCLLSDDVIFSNYYSKYNIPMNVVSYPGKHSIQDLWSNKSILEYGNQDDALHCGASGLSGTNIDRYPIVLDILKKHKDLHIKVYSTNNQLQQQFY